MFQMDPYRAVNPEIVSGAYGDVNGDGIMDYVFLTAVKSEDPSSPYVTQITLNIQDGATKRIHPIPLDKNGNSGYQPTLFLGDFTKDGVSDILITIDSGGSGALTFNYVYSFRNNQAKKLFDFNAYNEENQYSVTFMDQYRVKIDSPATGKTYWISLAGRSADYLSQIYHQNGSLKKPIQGMADGVSGFYPVDMERDGVYEIQAYQQISGLYHADSFGYIINTLKWDGQKFAIWQQWFAMYGNDSR
ncbi:VCBS repeat-containing protein [Ornithinibacillus gellani]|uniref:FG-GAP repeat domain-containing protein n=1 Tax=Ornithinibacillus gellani TaxID=2293253 RepID=UPI000F497370|nr:VCBS repeat-containing protein [Ornithinibacillus gellani]TQS71249.1 VCBS repeat-containing protein [Ornithinibacillus gellani]